tara:strand:- start:156 stop:1076 length:921 start_codon:yes stop_codon:yes gene_type:complete
MVNKGLSPEELEKMNSRHKQSLQNIKQLQTMEKELYASLDTSVSGRSISKAEQQQTITKINELSTMRMNLYMNMKDMYLFLQTNVSDTRNNLVNDLTNIGVVEGELNNAKSQLKLLEKERYDKLRMVEINTYYSDRYQAHTDVMKLVIFTCVPVLIIAVIANKGFITSEISNLVIAIIIAIGVIYISYSIYDISRRDNMNFNAYKGPISTSSDSDTQGEDYSDEWNGDDSDKKPSEPCVGKDCCTDGMVFDSATQTCKDVTEGMISSQLLKGSTGIANDSVNLQGSSSEGGSVIMPYSDTENYAVL